MSISVQCPGCGKKFKGEDRLAGKRVKCPSCGQSILVAGGPPVPSEESRIQGRPNEVSTVEPLAPRVPSVRRVLWPWYAGGGVAALALVAAAAFFITRLGSAPAPAPNEDRAEVKRPESILASKSYPQPEPNPGANSEPPPERTKEREVPVRSEPPDGGNLEPVIPPGPEPPSEPMPRPVPPVNFPPEPGPGPGPVAPPVPEAPGFPQFKPPGVPGFSAPKIPDLWLLRDQGIREHIQLTDEQYGKLRLAHLKLFVDPSVAFTEQGRKQRAAAEKELNQVMTAQQAGRLRQLSLQQQGPFALLFVQDLKLDFDQFQAVSQVIRDRLPLANAIFDEPIPAAEKSKKMADLNKRTQEQAVRLLTGAQQEKWKQAIGEPYPGTLPGGLPDVSMQSALLPPLKKKPDQTTKVPAPPVNYPPGDLARDLPDLARFLSEPYMLGHRKIGPASLKGADPVLRRIAATGDPRLKTVARDLREQLRRRDVAQYIIDRSEMGRDHQLTRPGQTVLGFILKEAGLDWILTAVMGEEFDDAETFKLRQDWQKVLNEIDEAAIALKAVQDVEEINSALRRHYAELLPLLRERAGPAAGQSPLKVRAGFHQNVGRISIRNGGQRLTNCTLAVIAVGEEGKETVHHLFIPELPAGALAFTQLFHVPQDTDRAKIRLALWSDQSSVEEYHVPLADVDEVRREYIAAIVAPGRIYTVKTDEMHERLKIVAVKAMPLPQPGQGGRPPGFRNPLPNIPPVIPGIGPVPPQPNIPPAVPGPGPAPPAPPVGLFPQAYSPKRPFQLEVTAELERIVDGKAEKLRLKGTSQDSPSSPWEFSLSFPNPRRPNPFQAGFRPQQLPVNPLTPPIMEPPFFGFGWYDGAFENVGLLVVTRYRPE